MFICPACGFPDLEKEYTVLYGEFCPCCDFQFNVTDYDEGYTYEGWREKWIKEGMRWDEGNSKPPKNWDPVKQLENLKNLAQNDV